MNLWHLHAACSLGIAVLYFTGTRPWWIGVYWLLIAALSTVTAEMLRATGRSR
jgi:hypothetical protein